MGTQVMEVGPAPPLKATWTSTVDLANVASGPTALYGITNEGRVVALDPATGAVRWTTTTVHLRNRLTVSGTKVYTYKKDDGLTVISDQGTSFTEKTVVAINPLTESDPISNIVPDGDKLYMAVNQALLVLKPDGDLITGTSVGSQTPYMLALAGPDQCLAVDGYGQLQAFRLDGTTLKRQWTANLNTPGTGMRERPILVTNGLAITGANGRTIAFQVSDGEIRWESDLVAAEALAETGETVFVIGHSGQTLAVNTADGQVVWRRMYLSESTPIDGVGASVGGEFLYVSAKGANGAPNHLFALEATTGDFAWQGAPATAGLAVPNGNRLIVYGTSQSVFALEPVTAKISARMFTWSPNPLRGDRTDFSGQLTIDLPVSARLTIRALRESEGLGEMLVDNATKTPGMHTVQWNAGRQGGFTDVRQFGRLLVDVSEVGGPSYTLAQIVPINTLPDLLGHWAKENVEIMIYHKYIGGYPDLTFRPDNMITRAECSAIIAKTLGLNEPSPGFRTKFTDIDGHWAQEQIMALEEKDIIGGFSEPDGTFTFRPNLNMSRAQEARILVKAYAIPAAPNGFTSRFTDIALHWAKPDIEALEAAGYVRGFQEDNGTFTYRPEQPLTRAELCTVVVRIRKLSRP